MACRKGELREESKNGNDAAKAAAAAAASVVVGDALLFTMMCIIGMPVDAHAKDGSIYSGIFHTASVDEEYAIMLKKARMIKNESRDANVVIVKQRITKNEHPCFLVSPLLILQDVGNICEGLPALTSLSLSNNSMSPDITSLPPLFIDSVDMGIQSRDDLRL